MSSIMLCMPSTRNASVGDNFTQFLSEHVVIILGVLRCGACSKDLVIATARSAQPIHDLWALAVQILLGFTPLQRRYLLSIHTIQCVGVRRAAGCWSLVPHGLGMGCKYALGQFLLTCHGNRLFDRRDPVFSKQL